MVKMSTQAEIIQINTKVFYKTKFVNNDLELLLVNPFNKGFN